ncbi:MAG: sugar ABC transporter permease [Thermomicrobiales bacterium]|nr:sugar ABC transporter permease [Thermomicrobiales bacterium]
MSGAPALAPAVSSAVPRQHAWADQNAKYVFLLPAVLYLLLLGIFPLIFSVYLVFSSWQSGSGITFVGLDNIRRLMVDVRFQDAVTRTLAYVALTAGLELAIGLLIALALQFATIGKSALRLALALPMLLPPIAISFAWKLLFDYNKGPVNYALDAIGLPRVTWLSGQTSALVSLVVVDIWQWTPFIALATLAALESLPTEIYEAALVDGAGLRAVLRDITLPLLTPYLVAIVLLRAVDAFKVFDTVYVLTGGGPGTATELLSFYAYAAGFRTFNMGFTATVAWATAILMTLVFLLYLRAFRRIEEA